MMKKRIFITLAVIVVVFAGYFIKHRSTLKPDLSTDIWVEAHLVKEKSLPLEVRALGSLIARSVEITPEIAGSISGILFRDGTFIEKGKPLIQLDDVIYKAKLASAKAETEYSQNNLKRMELLGKKGAIAKQAIDQAEADFKEKQANMKETEIMVNKMKLLAPFSGVIGKSKVQLGDYVTVGEHLVSLTDTRHLRVEYNVTEKYLPLLKLGQEVKVKTSAYPDKIFIGKVAFISPTINTDNRSVLIYAEIINSDSLLAPGMFVNVSHVLGGNKKVLMIPARSLVPVIDGEQVYKVTDGKAYAVSILTGKRDDQEIEVVQGLKANDLVITDGQLKIKNGISVKLKN